MKSCRSQDSPPAGRVGPVCAPDGLAIAAPSPSKATDAALAVDALLLALGAEVAPLTQLAQDPRALHLRLKALYETFGVFAIP